VSNQTPVCAVCNKDLDWVQCWDCGGEGQHNQFDTDPLWYGDYDSAWEDCETCNGHGGWKRCGCVTEKPMAGEPSD